MNFGEKHNYRASNSVSCAAEGRWKLRDELNLKTSCIYRQLLQTAEQQRQDGKAALKIQYHFKIVNRQSLLKVKLVHMESVE